MEKHIDREYNWKYKGVFKEFDWMINDLWRGIQSESNYLVALGLFAYSEAIGWKLLGENDKEKDNYKCYLEFTGRFIPEISLEEDEYRNVRNGLAHRYFVKNKFGSILNYESENLPVLIKSINTIEINVYSYFKLFVKGVENYLDENSEIKGTGPIDSHISSAFFLNSGATGPPGPNLFQNTISTNKQCGPSDPQGPLSTNKK